MKENARNFIGWDWITFDRNFENQYPFGQCKESQFGEVIIETSNYVGNEEIIIRTGLYLNDNYVLCAKEDFYETEKYQRIVKGGDK